MIGSNLATLFDQALSHHRANRFAAAEPLYRHILTIDPDHASALGMLGSIALQTDRAAVALELLDAALRLRPGEADVLGYRGLALKGLGRIDEAIASFKAALRRKPGSFDLLFNLANSQREAGQLAAAVATFRRAIRRKPDFLGAHNNLGNTLRQLGQAEAAAEAFRRAIALSPDAAPLHVNLAAALELAGQPALAVDSLSVAARLAPGSADIWRQLGQVSARLGETEAARGALTKALGLGADDAALHQELAAALALLDRRGEALEHLRRAAVLAPSDPRTHANLGMLLRDLGDDDGALASLDRALVLDPAYAPARYHLGLTHLLAGRLAQGFPLYEARQQAMTGSVGRFPDTPWRGEKMPGRTLLLHAEQGLGDTLQFCRFVSMAAAVSEARVVLEVQGPLLRLLTGLPGVTEIVAAGNTPVAFDVHCPLPSLPTAFATNLATLPANVPYLRADPNRVAAWQERLAGISGRKIGLVWAGNPDYEHDALRSLPPAALAALDGIPKACFVSLQKERGLGLDGKPPRPIAIDWTGELGDVAETAALMQALDLVISADTAMVHLGGALGRPVWLLNRYDTDWRWMRDRTEDSPWYPTLRQFRQPRRGDWAGVLTAVKAALIGRE